LPALVAVVSIHVSLDNLLHKEKATFYMATPILVWCFAFSLTPLPDTNFENVQPRRATEMTSKTIMPKQTVP